MALVITRKSVYYMKKFLCFIGIILLLALMLVGIGLISYSRNNNSDNSNNLVIKSVIGIKSIFN